MQFSVHFLLNKLLKLLCCGLSGNQSVILAMGGNGKKLDAASRLGPLEVETIHLFVQFSRALGQPRSVAEIYGLLFVSPQPLTLDDLIARLNLSKGSGSQGLKYLQDIGAVRTVYVAGERRTHYQAVAELRNLAGRFLRQQILIHFEDSDTRLDRIADAAQKLSGEPRKHALARVKTLRNWEKNGRRILPFVVKMLGGGQTP
jgi:DNA-binding transcriptional regulator GbsR (MarR family)